MAKRLPPLNPLRAFEATARHASLTKAASELNVTHGAISHQIKALEQSLGVKLFERTGQRVKLTPHGAELLPAVSTAFDGIAAATQRMTRPASAGSSSAPCGVSFTRCPVRSNSFTPSDCSSALIWWLMAPWVTFSSLAALVSEAWRAVASKARRGFRGGRRLAMGNRILCEIFSQPAP